MKKVWAIRLGGLAILFVMAFAAVPGSRRWLIMTFGTKTTATVTKMEEAGAVVSLSYEYAKHRATYADLRRGPNGPHVELYKPIPIRCLRWLPSWVEFEDDGGASKKETVVTLLAGLMFAAMGVILYYAGRVRIRVPGLGWGRLPEIAVLTWAVGASIWILVRFLGS